MALPRISKVFAAVDAGSFRISAMILGISETGEMIVLGTGHRASQGIRRGYVTDMAAATYAIRDAVERAEKAAGTRVSSVWVGCSGAGLASQVARVEILSETGSHLKLISPWDNGARITNRKGTLTTADRLIEIDTAKGERITLVPQDPAALPSTPTP